MLLAAWAALTLAALAFVLTFGSNCPNADEWEFVPALTGHEPLGPWLWAQHNEHRLPLPRLIYYGLFQLTHDFRAGAILQVALLSLTSLGLMRLAARLRGSPQWTDLVFPVSLVHVGHWENLLIGYNLCFALILVLETGLGLTALFARPETLFRSGCVAGVLMVLLCLCGGGGVVAAIPVAVWIGYRGTASLIRDARHRSVARAAFRNSTASDSDVAKNSSNNSIGENANPSDQVLPMSKLDAAKPSLSSTNSRPSPSQETPPTGMFETPRNTISLARSSILLLFAVFPVLYLSVYLQDYHRPGHHPEVGDGGFDIAVVTAQVLSMAFGFGVHKSWLPVAVGLTVLGGATMLALLRDARQPAKRPAAFGLLAVVAGIAGVALVIGLSRAGLDQKHEPASRYSYLVWPLIPLAYLVWMQRGGWAGKWVPVALCTVAALAYPANMISGSVVSSKIRLVLAAVEADARAGVPPERIVRHFKGTFQAYQEERAVRAIPMLKEAKVGAFAESRR